jgi:hypothetical protein
VDQIQLPGQAFDFGVTDLAMGVGMDLGGDMDMAGMQMGAGFGTGSTSDVVAEGYPGNEKGKGDAVNDTKAKGKRKENQK